MFDQIHRDPDVLDAPSLALTNEWIAPAFLALVRTVLTVNAAIARHDLDVIEMRWAMFQNPLLEVIKDRSIVGAFQNASTEELSQSPKPTKKWKK